MKKFYSWANIFIERIWTGKMMSILKSWILNRNDIALFFFRDFTKAFFVIVFSLYIILQKSVIFFCASLWFVIVMFVWIRYFGDRARRFRKQAKKVEVESDRQIVKQIMSKFETLHNNKIDQEISMYLSLRMQTLRLKLEEKFFQWLAYDGAVFFANILKVIILWLVGWWIFHTSSSLSEFVLLATLTWILSSTVDSIAGIWKKITDNMIHVEKLWDTFDHMGEMKNVYHGSPFTYQSWNISIKNLSFSYDQNPVFQDFNLEIRWWTRTAFVWESWWGKTTLIKLLAGYIRPDVWDIIIDDQKLADIKLTDYYKHIGYLTQDPSVFDASIYENLVYALDTEPERSQLEEVIKLARCAFIREFEHGLQTEIWERWVRLSWWQKQRLAIAKIMLKNPNIILLDEPTSALDSFNEEQISLALHNLFQGKTVIIVAHRLQTVKKADRILLLDQGKVVEEGTHDQLVALDGKYKKMLDLQSGF